jgi:D-3-phosphoglycerate dehydrogenase
MKVFIPEVEEPSSLERLRGLAEVKTGVKGQSYSEQDLTREMVDVDVVVIASQHKVTREVIEKAPRLRGIVKYGSKPGYDNVDMTAANERRIAVAYTEGANADSVAEFTVMLVLALAKRLPGVISYAKERRWRDQSYLGLELADKTAGIVGLGVIGSKVARKLSGLDMKVIARDPYVPSENANRLRAKLVDMNTLLHESDIVTLHAKVTPETTHMIGKNEFALMKRTAYLINTARGALTDEEALYAALRDGKIAGAALDVYETEPPSPENPLLTLDNVILTPHIASWTADALRKEAFMAVDEVLRIINGSRPANLANPEAFG